SILTIQRSTNKMRKIGITHNCVFDTHYFPMDTLLPAYIVVKGVEVHLDSMKIVARRAPNTLVQHNAIGQIELINQANSDSVAATADRQRIVTLYGYIEDHSYASASYRDIKFNQLWRQVYRILPHPIYHWNKRTPAAPPALTQIDFGFCNGSCGYFLPLDV